MKNHPYGPDRPSATPCVSVHDMPVHSCRIRAAPDGVHAVCTTARVHDPQQVPDASIGIGADLNSAIAQAIGTGVLQFATPEDEREACVAALRDQTVRIRVHRRRIRVLERGHARHRTAIHRRVSIHTHRHRRRRHAKPRVSRTAAHGRVA